MGDNEPNFDEIMEGLKGERLAFSQHPWCNCVKAGNATVAEDGTKKGAFTWADGFCSDFRPKQEAQESRSQNGGNR